MKKLLKWVGIVFGVLIAIGIIFGEKPKGDGAAPAAAAPAAKEAAKEVVKLSAGELFSSYEANEVATDEKLKGKLVEVSGTVQAIDKDAFDKIVVRLRTTNQFMPASMYVDDAQKSKAMALNKGVKAVLRCERVSRMIGAPHGSDCTIL